jgi:hypothetical protein
VKIEQAIYSLLSGDTSIQTMVGDRIYPLVAPQSITFPFLIYQESGHSRTASIAGNTMMRLFRCRIDGYSESYSDAKDIRDSVLDRLVNYNGTVGNISIHYIDQEDTSDEHLPPVHSDERGIFGAGLDFAVYYTGGD